MEVKKIKKREPNIENGSGGKLNVAAYARVSSSSDNQLTSFESQKLYYENKITKNEKWNYVEVYADEGISGSSSKKRENFLRMIRDCIIGKIDLILTKSISRFARNTVDTLKYVRLLKERNIAIIFEEENINTLDKSGEFLLTVLSSVAQQEIENMSSHVRKGHIMLLKRGELILGEGCYGYRFNNKDQKIEIVPEEAKVVKDIFRLFLSGTSIGEIVRILEKNNIKTYKNKSNWGITNIKNMLRNEKYAGDLLQNKYVKMTPFSNRVKNNGLMDKYLIKDHHEPIISKEDFNKVQEIIKTKYDSRFNHNKRVLHCLSYKMICGYCYSSINMVRSKNTGAFVECSNRKKNSRSACPESRDMHLLKIINVIKKGISHARKNILNDNDNRLSYIKRVLFDSNEITDDIIRKTVKFAFIGGYDSYNRPDPFLIRVILFGFFPLSDYQIKKISKEEIKRNKTKKIFEEWISQKITTYGPPGPNYKRKDITKVKLIIEIENNEDCTFV